MKLRKLGKKREFVQYDKKACRCDAQLRSFCLAKKWDILLKMDNLSNDIHSP